MEASTWRRSPALRATRRWTMPAPMSKPSSTTYIAIITATSMNQTVGTLHLLRSVLDFAIDQQQEQHSQNRVHAHETDQSEQRITGGDMRRDSCGRAQQAIDEPGLAAGFGGDPSGGVGDVREGNHEHEYPQELALREEAAAPKLQRGEGHDRDEDGPEANHDVIGEIEQ